MRSVIPREYRGCLGSRDNGVLGRNLQIGSHFYTSSRCFTLVIDNPDYAVCSALFPGSPLFADLDALIRLYLKQPLEYDLEFRVGEDTIPKACLNGSCALGVCVHLPSRRGQTAVLKISASAFINSQQSSRRHV